MGFGGWGQDTSEDEEVGPDVDAVILRGREASDRRRWRGTITGAVGSVVAALLLACVFRVDRGDLGTRCVLGALGLGAAGAVALAAWRQVRVDGRGVSIRTVRSRLTPWEDVATIRVLRREDDDPSVAMISADGIAVELGRARDPEAVVAACSAMRPDDADAELSGRPSPPLTEPPGRVLVVASPWHWAYSAGMATVVIMFAAQFTVQNLVDDRLDWSFELPFAFLVVGFAAVPVLTSRRTRTALMADDEAVTYVRWSSRRRIAMGDIEGFTRMPQGRASRRPGSIVLLVGEDAVCWPVPDGRAGDRVDLLVDRLEQLRTWGAVPSDSTASALDAYDVDFRPRRAPSPRLQLVMLFGLAVIAVALVLSVALAVVADHRSVDAILARSQSTTGTVTAIDTTSSEPRALVQYPTTRGPMTAELAIEPDEANGETPLDLRYDPQRPTQVWRAGSDPSVFSAWTGGALLALGGAVMLGLGLWLSWHPPTAADPRPSHHQGLRTT